MYTRALSAIAQKRIVYLYTAMFFCFEISSNLSAQFTFFPANIIGGKGDTLTINGSGFGAVRDTSYVSFYQESGSYMNSGEGNNLAYISWSNTQIKVEMPNAFSNKVKVFVAGVAQLSVDTLHVKANVTLRTVNPRDYTYLSGRAAGSMLWYMNKTYWDNAPARQAIEELFKEFRCKTGVNYVLADSPTTAGSSLSDTLNVITPKATGLPGYNSRLWMSCGSVYANINQDIELSDMLAYYYGSGANPPGQVKFRYVLMHELGHSIGLGHVNEYGQTMFPSVTLLPSDIWCARDSITSEEKQAMQFCVNVSENYISPGCGIYPLAPFDDCENIYNTSANVLPANASSDTYFKFYESEAKNIFVFETIYPEAGRINIYNALGQAAVSQVFGKYENQLRLDLSLLQPGMYIAQLKLLNGKSASCQFLVSNN